MASTTGWEYLLNTALFLPLGLLAASVGNRVPVEAATRSDLSANTIGTVAGASIAGIALENRAKRRAAAAGERSTTMESQSSVGHGRTGR